MGFDAADLAQAFLPVSTRPLQVNAYNVTNTLCYNMRTRWSNMPSVPRTVMAPLKVEL